jgi:hypothetical protein
VVCNLQLKVFIRNKEGKERGKEIKKEGREGERKLAKRCRYRFKNHVSRKNEPILTQFSDPQ